MQKAFDENGKYLASSQLIAFAVKELESKFKRDRLALTSPSAVKDYLKLKMAGLEHEIFYCLYLDAQHRIVGHEELFRGTLTQTSVYPREVVKRALHFNCGAIIFAHNHPSGVAEPSRADECLTIALKQALALVEVRVLDHIIVGVGESGPYTMSFAERGLL